LGAPTVHVLSGQSELIAANITGSFHFLSAGPVRDLSLTFLMGPKRSGVSLVLEADAVLYSTASLALHEERLLTLMREALRQPEWTLGDLPVMDSCEHAAVAQADTGCTVDDGLR